MIVMLHNTKHRRFCFIVSNTLKTCLTVDSYSQNSGKTGVGDSTRWPIRHGQEAKALKIDNQLEMLEAAKAA